MDELQNTARNYNQVDDDNSTIRRVIADIERLISMLSNEFDENISPSLYRQSSSSTTTITNVTITDDNHRLIEHLRHRINRLEHERNVLLTSYQLLIKLLK
jgi:hypothetical protein